MALDYKMRCKPPTAVLERQALALKVPLVRFGEMTCRDICKEVRKNGPIYETSKSNVRPDALNG